VRDGEFIDRAPSSYEESASAAQCQKRVPPSPGGASVSSESPSGAARPVLAVATLRSADLLDNEAAGRQRTQQFIFGTGQVEPGKPVGSVEHNDLTIMDRCYVGSGANGSGRWIRSSRTPVMFLGVAISV